MMGCPLNSTSSFNMMVKSSGGDSMSFEIRSCVRQECALFSTVLNYMYKCLRDFLSNRTAWVQITLEGDNLAPLKRAYTRCHSFPYIAVIGVVEATA